MALEWDVKKILGERDATYVVAHVEDYRRVQYLVSYGVDDEGNDQTIFAWSLSEAKRYDKRDAVHHANALRRKGMEGRVVVFIVDVGGLMREI